MVYTCLPQPQHLPPPQVELFELTFYFLPFSLFCLISDFLFATSIAKAMSCFSSSLNYPMKFKTTQGSDPTPSK